MAPRKTFTPNVDTLDPAGRFVYISEDESATTKKRKVIVRDSVTGDKFSCIYDKVRQGDVVPPSQKGANKANGYEKARKYTIGDIVGPKDNIRIIGEMESFLASNGNMTRKFIFRNLDNGKIFDNTLDDVVKGKVTGARSKKSEEDYSEYELISEEDAAKITPKVDDDARSKWKNITKQELERLINTMSSSEIAKIYGVSFQSVCRKVNAMGIVNPNKQ